MIDSSFVTTGKYGGRFVGTDGILQRHADSGARFTRGTTADGVDDHENGTVFRCENAVYFSRCAGLFDAVLREVLAHGDEELFRIGHTLKTLTDCRLSCRLALNVRLQHACLRLLLYAFGMELKVIEGPKPRLAPSASQSRISSMVHREGLLVDSQSIVESDPALMAEFEARWAEDDKLL